MWKEAHESRDSERIDFLRVLRNQAYADLNMAEAESWNDASEVLGPYGSRPVWRGNAKMQASTTRESKDKQMGVRQIQATQGRLQQPKKASAAL